MGTTETGLGQSRGRGMTARHSATRAATLCGTAVLGACVVVSLVGFGQSKDTARIDTHHAAFPSAGPAPVNPLSATVMANTGKLGDDVMTPGPSVTETAAWAKPVSITETKADGTPRLGDDVMTPAASVTETAGWGKPESITEAKAPDAQNIETAGSSGQTEPIIEAATADSLHAGQAETNPAAQALAPEMSPVPMTTAEAPESPHTEAEYAVSALETFDECPVPDICIDQYLWSAYQRTPKRDTVKEVEHKKVTIRKKGKTRTINKTVTKLLDEDFTWKDVKAAERASMSLKDYVIGGIRASS